jgi:hypothetical protein
VRYLLVVLLLLTALTAAADPGVRRPPELWRLDLDGDGVDEEVYYQAWVEDRHGYDETFLELTLEGRIIAEFSLGPQGYLTSIVPEPLPWGGEGLQIIYGRSFGLSAGYEDWTTLWAWSTEEERLTVRLNLLTAYHSRDYGLSATLSPGETAGEPDYYLSGIAVHEGGENAWDGFLSPAGYFEFYLPGRVELELAEDGNYDTAGYRGVDGVLRDWPVAERAGAQWIDDLEELRPWPREPLVDLWPETANSVPEQVLASAVELEGGRSGLWLEPEAAGITTLGGHQSPRLGLAYDETALYLWGPLGVAPPSALRLSLGTTPDSPGVQLSWAGGLGELELPEAARVAELGAGRFIIGLPWEVFDLDGPGPLHLLRGPQDGSEPPARLLVPSRLIDY